MKGCQIRHSERLYLAECGPRKSSPGWEKKVDVIMLQFNPIGLNRMGSFQWIILLMRVQHMEAIYTQFISIRLYCGRKARRSEKWPIGDAAVQFSAKKRWYSVLICCRWGTIIWELSNGMSVSWQAREEDAERSLKDNFWNFLWGWSTSFHSN